MILKWLLHTVYLFSKSTLNEQDPVQISLTIKNQNKSNKAEKELERLHIARDFVERSSITVCWITLKLVHDFHELSPTRLIYMIAGSWHILKCWEVSGEVLEIPKEMNTKFLSFKWVLKRMDFSKGLKTHQYSYFIFIGWCNEVGEIRNIEFGIEFELD